MKILFLDIDGVLNSLGTKPKDPRGLTDWIDPANAAPLARALLETGASLVVTSSWRLSTRFEELTKVLEQNGLAPVVGVTRSLGQGVRASEILDWLGTNAGMEDWLALDDETLDGMSERQIRTSRVTGLTEKDADEIVRRFGAPR